MTEKFDLYVIDELDLKAISLFEKIKSFHQKKSQCGITCGIKNKYPNIGKQMIRIMLLNGLSLEETEIVAEEIKDMNRLQQLTTVMQRI